METDVISTNEAAETLGVTPRRVLALIESGKLPAMQMGRFYVIRKADLALVAERKAGRPKKEAEAVVQPTKTKKAATKAKR